MTKHRPNMPRPPSPERPSPQVPSRDGVTTDATRSSAPAPAAVPSRVATAVLFSIAIGLVACTDASPPTDDAPVDAAVDSERDGVETPTDALEDAGAPEDAGADTATDVEDTPPAETDAGPPRTESWPTALRPLSASDDRRIVDDLGRDVLLRGVNVTSLGDYWQGDPTQPPTLPTTDDDWDAMAAAGVSVIRLVVHWSLIEPERERVDEGYLAQIDTYVTAAADRGIYTVIDMHQDAYTATVWTPEHEECPEGTRPAKGWDGAPAWAVFTDGASTCTPGDRNGSPAIQNAWNHFYDNTDGIQDRFVASWAAVAAYFAGRPEVAGYDLLNEPDVSRPAPELTPLYDQLMVDVIDAIRAAESDAPFEHLAFIETAIPAGNQAFGLVFPNPSRVGAAPSNVVFSPHNYAETIPVAGPGLTFELANELYLSAARALGVPTWIGEYGFWSTSESTLEKLDRYAADEDRHLLAGAWWQWRQPCGDPHSVGPTGEHTVVHLNSLACPGDIDLGPTEPLFRVFSRGYPRAAPGRLQSLESDPETGRLDVRATVDTPGGELIVWTPTAAETHDVVLDGPADLRTFPVGDGRVLVATVDAAGDYGLSVVRRPE